MALDTLGYMENEKGLNRAMNLMACSDGAR